MYQPQTYLLKLEDQHLETIFQLPERLLCEVLQNGRPHVHALNIQTVCNNI